MASPPDLSRSAQAAVECLGVDRTDSVLVLYSQDQQAIADALAAAARPRARAVTLSEFPTLSRHGEEPPIAFAEAMARADVVIAPTSHSITQTQARIDASSGGTRIATLPTITEQIFARAVPVDYDSLRRTGRLLAGRLTEASSARVTSAGGTEIVLSLDGRSALSDDGDLRARGAFGNLPAGEAYIAPLETVGDGTIVFDGSLAGHGLLSSPLRITVEGGRAIAADGAASAWLLETLDAGGEHGRSLAELGVGTNPAATLSGNILEDEKVIGTVHLAFGTSAGLGGDNIAGVHIDGIVLRPTLELDGERVLDEGRLLLP